MIKEKELSWRQKEWLNQRGGRSVIDVVWIDNSPYVMMKDGNKARDIAVRVPEI